MAEPLLSRELFQERAVLLAVNAAFEGNVPPLLAAIQKAAKAVESFYMERDEAQAYEAVREFHLQIGNLHSRVIELRSLLLPSKGMKASSAPAPAASSPREVRPAMPARAAA